MVKADCGGCKGCSMCCEDMVDTIILDPLDIYRLTNALHTTFEAMLGTQLELEVYDGLILPHLKKSIKTGGCPFLDENRRCSVHADRPGFCRIFPLGRMGILHIFCRCMNVRSLRQRSVSVSGWTFLMRIRTVCLSTSGMICKRKCRQVFPGVKKFCRKI